jgi:hypothetical protein
VRSYFPDGTICNPSMQSLDGSYFTLPLYGGNEVNSRYLLPIAQSAFVAICCGCASVPNIAPPEVPEALRPSAGQTVFVEALASGVQIYECAPKADQPSTFEWIFRAPLGREPL